MLSRQAAYQRRKKKGVAVFRVMAHEHQVVETLLDAAWLTPEEALDRRHVEEALAGVIQEWVERWQKK